MAFLRIIVWPAMNHLIEFLKNPQVNACVLKVIETYKIIQYAKSAIIHGKKQFFFLLITNS